MSSKEIKTFLTCDKEIEIKTFDGIVVENPACPQNVEPVIYGRLYPSIFPAQVAPVIIMDNGSTVSRVDALYLGSSRMSINDDFDLHYWMFSVRGSIYLGCMVEYDGINAIDFKDIYILDHVDYLTELLFNGLIYNLGDK